MCLNVPPKRHASKYYKGVAFPTGACVVQVDLFSKEQQFSNAADTTACQTDVSSSTHGDVGMGSTCLTRNLGLERGAPNQSLTRTSICRGVQRPQLSSGYCHTPQQLQAFVGLGARCCVIPLQRASPAASLALIIRGLLLPYDRLAQTTTGCMLMSSMRYAEVAFNPYTHTRDLPLRAVQ
jgi:hypothetical protein